MGMILTTLFFCTCHTHRLRCCLGLWVLSAAADKTVLPHAFALWSSNCLVFSHATWITTALVWLPSVGRCYCVHILWEGCPCCTWHLLLVGKAGTLMKGHLAKPWCSLLAYPSSELAWEPCPVWDCTLLLLSTKGLPPEAVDQSVSQHFLQVLSELTVRS